MLRYLTADHSSIFNSDDSMFIPCTPGNSDYDKIIRDKLEVLAYEAPPAPPVEHVSQWQAREALRLAGLLGAVNSYIDALGDADAAYIAWHYAERIRRNSPFVEVIGPALGLKEEQIDALFTQAAGLSL